MHTLSVLKTCSEVLTSYKTLPEWIQNRAHDFQVKNWQVKVSVTGIVSPAISLKAIYSPGGQVGVLVRKGFRVKFSYVRLDPADILKRKFGTLD